MIRANKEKEIDSLSSQIDILAISNKFIHIDLDIDPQVLNSPNKSSYYSVRLVLSSGQQVPIGTFNIQTK